MTIKRTLVGLGGTEYTPVTIRRASELAQHHQAEIGGVTVMDESRLRDVGPVPVGGAHAACAAREHRLEVSRQSVPAARELPQDGCERRETPLRIHQESGDLPLCLAQ
jgi:hypothetical protein